MRQMNPAPSCTVPAVENPAACRASYPVVGVASQPRLIDPSKCRKSTATSTPREVVQLLTGSAAAGAGAVSVTPAATSAAPVTAPTLHNRAGRGRQSVARRTMSGGRRDASEAHDPAPAPGEGEPEAAQRRRQQREQELPARGHAGGGEGGRGGRLGRRG